MSVIIKSTEMNYKDPTTGEYTGINVLAEKKTSEFLDAIDVKGETVISDIPASYDDLNNIIAESYDATKTYNIGDCVRYYNGTNDKLYKCIASTENDSSWVDSHWVEVVACNEISAISEGFDAAYVTEGVNISNQGLTITTANDKLQIYGTASAQRNICFLNGQEVIKISTSAFEKTLDAGTYIFITDQTGYENKYLIKATYTTFANGFTIVSSADKEKAVTFTAPVMIAYITVNNRNYGTSEDPTYFSISIKKVTAVDLVARKRTENIPEVDEELAEHGQAADAKVVGEKINNINTIIENNTISVSVTNLIWTSGGIRINDGVDSNETNRVRTSLTAVANDCLKFENAIIEMPVTISVKEGYQVSCREYSSYSDNPNILPSYYIGAPFGRWVTSADGDYNLTITKGNYYRFVIRKATNDDMAISDLPEDLLTINYTSLTDAELVLSNKAADAKIVGEKIDFVSESVVGLSKGVTHGGSGFLKWYQGTIDPSTGGNISSTNRVRAGGIFGYKASVLVIVDVPDGIKISGRIYTSNVGSEQTSSYVGTLTDGWKNEPFSFIPTNNYYYRYIASYEDDSAITPNDPILQEIKTYVIKFQNEQAVSYSSGSLLGNISVRGAKTIYFDDETPPIIEWYLLMDINNNFYISKNLTSKTFLFNFVPPSADVNDWSNGIDAKNNIFFFKDAAGYTSADGPRLDDGKRVNPVYFLAEENYSTMHELNFGTEFKPAGFIPTGWCLLPNNDILMCEYTRGTLKTANVWHVDGSDATDPENWTRTWSHEIEDTGDIGHAMKHCHFIIYDFYTGICYFGTGDSNNGSWIYHSLDNGMTWTLTYGPDRETCRQINLIFTKNKIYFASDDPFHKSFFIADRDSNGVLDIANASRISLMGSGNPNKQSCYGCVYIEQLGLVMMMDRCDTIASYPIEISGYDIESGEIKHIATLPAASDDVGFVGFKCKFVDWYPVGNEVQVGFSPKPRSTNPDSNTIGVCGNLGGITGDGSDRINNLRLHVYKNSNGEYSMRITTLYL